MIGGGKRELPHTVALRICVDPKKQIFCRTDAKSQLVLGWTRKSGVDNIDVTSDHRTP